MKTLKSMINPLAIAGVVALSALPVAAQEMTAASCETQFTNWDTDGNGILTEAEAPAVFARARVDGMTIADGGYAKADFVAACAANSFAPQTLDEGAPLEGANSFTEEQAKDRAIAWGYTDVATLVKDDKGIWRGTAMHNGGAVDVAIDFKGNVVSTAK